MQSNSTESRRSPAPSGPIATTLRWTIRRKLTLIITGVSTVAVFVAGTVLVAYNLISYHRQIGTNMLTQVSVVANNCKSAVAFGEPSDAQDVLRALRADPSIDEAFVYSSDGSVFAAYARVGNPEPWAAPEAQEDGFRFGTDSVLAFQRVTLGADTIGSVCLVFDTSRLYAFMVRSVLWLVLVVLLTVLASGFLANKLQRVISKPVDQLVRTAKVVTETRNYTVRAEKVRSDELGMLSDAFNEMLEEIQKRDQALRFTQFSVDHSGDAAYWMGTDGRFVYVNNAACSVLGYSEAELLEMTVHDIDTQFQEEAWGPHWEALRKYRTMVLESTHRARDGTLIPVEITANLVEFEGREFNCAFARNISERRQAQAALSESEERFRSIFENAVMGLYRTTPEGRILMANPALARMLGYDSPKELMTRDLAQEGFSPDAPRSDFIETLDAQERVVGLESKWTRKDGSILFVSESSRAIRNDNEEVLYYDGTVEDITIRKRAEEELKTRERFLACLSEVSQNLLRQEDPARALPGVLQALGSTANASRSYLFRNGHDDAGRLVSSLIDEWCRFPLTPRTNDDVLQNLPYEENGLGRWAEVMAAGGVISGAVSEFPEPERERLEPHGILSLLLIPLFVEGEWYGYIGFDACEEVREWTSVEIDLLQVAAAELGAAIENRHLFMRLRDYANTLEDRVALRTAELSNVNRELEAFSYSVSHDLRAPLRSIDGFSQALQEDMGDVADRQAQDYLDRIRAAAQRMGQLIEDLLRLSRLTRKEMTVQPVSLSELAQSVTDDLRAHEPDRDVEVLIDEKLTTQGDPQLLRILLENLIGNSWKFTSRRSEARIVLGSQELDSKTTFFVRDNGAGFDMEYSKKLFGAFQRLHGAEEFDGTGIGLATVQRIVHRHGGNIWAEGKVDQGATFYFTLG